MPIEKKYALEAVLKAAAAFRKRVTFEYVLIAGKNDSDADAEGSPSWPDSSAPWSTSCRCIRAVRAGCTTAPARIREFADRLRNQGIEAPVRRSRGLDINAACGQLRVKMEKKERGP